MAGVVATIASNQPRFYGGLKAESYTLTNGSPTIVGGAGAGTATGGVATIAGLASGAATDVAGRITITTGTTTASGTAVLATITFANSLAGTPSPIISPANVNAAALQAGTAAAWASAGTTTSWTIQSGSATALTAYIFDYSVPDALTNLAISTVYMGAPSEVKGMAVRNASFSGRTATIGVRPDFATSSLELVGQY